MNSFEINPMTRTETPEQIPPEEQINMREERLERAQTSYKEKFERKMAQIVDNIAENPYFRDLNERTF